MFYTITWSNTGYDYNSRHFKSIIAAMLTGAYLLMLNRHKVNLFVNSYH